MSKRTCESVLGCNNLACPVHYPATPPDPNRLPADYDRIFREHATELLAGDPKPAPDPKDQRIAELEAKVRGWTEQGIIDANGKIRLITEHSQLRVRIAELEALVRHRERQHADAFTRATELETELKQAREAYKAADAIGVKYCMEAADLREANQSLEAAAGRMRAQLERECADRHGADMAGKMPNRCTSCAALTESDAGTRALACVEALREADKYLTRADRVSNFIGTDSVMHRMFHDALSDWDQGAKPSGGKGDGDGQS